MSSNSPKDAAAVILLRQDTDPQNPELFWARRSPQLAFLGGFHAFPGGQIEQDDAFVDVRHANDQQTATMISGAARELFEELGVLLARGAESLTKGQRASLLDDLQSKRITWRQLLSHYELQLDADDFTFAGRWVTPPFSARRFDTWFFLANCPRKQDPHVIPGELVSGEWITANAAYESWFEGKVQAVPPTLHAIKTLAAGLTTDLVERFLDVPQADGEPVQRIEFRPNYICFPVRTPTKPPATHTNCYIIYTDRELLVIDPGSPYKDEQNALSSLVDEFITIGLALKLIVLTHLHPDHIGGVNALRQHVGGVQVAAHVQTAEALADITVDHLINDDDEINLAGSPPISLKALHTPGHARGHLCFYDADRGILITGDNIVGLGSVLIDPPQGNMRNYFASLRRMRLLSPLQMLMGGHGPAIANPIEKIDEYINHRLEREQRILNAFRDGATTSAEIVEVVYTDVSPKARAMAERAVIAHLEKLKEDGAI
ncbi:MAG: MBL fold metallo-hydrolase [Pyrinomonadaceae bacterium]